MTTLSSSYSFDGSAGSANNMTTTTQGSSGSSFDSQSPETLLMTRKAGQQIQPRNQRSQQPKRKKNKKNPKSKRRWTQDEFGESIANMLNENPDFHFSPAKRMPGKRKRSETEQNQKYYSDIDWNDTSLSTFRPLFGPQNRYRLQILTKCFWIVIRKFRFHRDIPNGLRNLRDFLFQPLPNRTIEVGLLPSLRFLLIVVSLIVLGSLSIASGVAIVVVSAWRFLGVVCFFSSSLFVDWNEIASLCPSWFLAVVDNVKYFVIQFDRVVLFGNRWRGREWNKDGFDFTDSFHLNDNNQPQSSIRGQYLWKFPPPHALTRSSKMIPNEGITPRNSNVVATESFESNDKVRPTTGDDKWGEYTALHVEAIDYCYIMLREEYIKQQYSKLKRMRSSFTEETQLDPGDGTRRRASSVVSLENFRQQFVLDPSANNIDPDEIDEVTGISIKLQEILREDEDSVEDCDSNAAADAHNTTLDSLRAVCNNDDDRTIGSGSDGTAIDMNWMDVGTEIGMKLLGSSAVQKAMASHDTVDKISSLKDKMDSHFKKDNSNKTFDGGFSRDSHPPTPFFDAEGGLSIFRASPKIQRPIATRIDNEQPLPSGYQLDSYAQALPVNPMWTSAAAAVSPTHSFSTIETFGTREDSTLSPGSSVASPSKGTTGLTPSPQQAIASEPTGSDYIEENDIALPKIDIVAVSPTPRQGNKKAVLNKLTDKLPKIPKIPKTLLGKGRKKKRKSKPAKEPSIELVCKEDEGRKKLIQQLTPPSSKSRRPMLLPGVKIAVPVLPITPKDPKQSSTSRKRRKEQYQMGTVVGCKRICVFEKNSMPLSGNRGTNCLAITVNLDKCFLRNGQFATMTLRVMDDWGPKYMPKHSKLPMGSCVATSFGLGVLVGWRVEDDVHIVRSLWQRRGSGSACAYLRRDSIHATMEAAVGFEVNTTRGHGTVVGYVNGGPQFKRGRYFVSIPEEGSNKKQVIELNRTDVLSCESAKFIPIVEHIRAAAQYQLQIDRYQELQDVSSVKEVVNTKVFGEFSKHFDILWKSFLKAIDEDHEFDDGMNEFIQKCVNFLNQLDAPGKTPVAQDDTGIDIDGFDASIVINPADNANSQHTSRTADSMMTPKGEEPDNSGFWLMAMFDIFNPNKDPDTSEDPNPAAEGIEIMCTPRNRRRSEKNYARAFAMLKTLTRTVTIAKAASADEPSFKIALAVCHEFLLFVKTVIMVQQKNMNHESLEIWRSAWREIVSVFGPVQKRLRRIGEGIAERMEKHGRRAKARLLRFVDIIVQDDELFLALEQGDWKRCAELFEMAIVQAKVIDEESREHYRKTIQFIYNHFSSATSKSDGAAARNNDKMEKILAAIQVFANPRKAILELFLNDSVLEMMERIFVRAFSKDEVASRMLNIHCSNFQSLRRFRMLKDFTIAGKLWIPILDAADEEFSWAVSKLPEKGQEYLSPISSLFSLCVVQFHKMDEGDLTKDWLNFLMDEEAADIIHDLDMKLILALEQFSRDVRDTMVVLPYYPSIDVDILNLVDDFNIDAFVKEASVALEDDAMLREFIKEKATIMVERILDYLPKIAIPVEKRELGEGWTLTCRGAGGGDLTLTELVIKRENITCQVLGGDSLLFPTAAVTLDELEDVPTTDVVNYINSPLSMSMPLSPVKVVEETSILTVIKEIIANAQSDGCYHIGEGGVQHPPTDKYAASALGNLPVSSVLNCAIDLWRNLEIDDDELLEVAIRDVSYQIELSESRDKNANGKNTINSNSNNSSSANRQVSSSQELVPRQSSSPPFLAPIDTWQISSGSGSEEMLEWHQHQPKPHRFNPRVDPTVLFLEIKKLTFCLENFLFRIEKHETKKTIFDPAFEGTGSILVKNVLIRLRVQCFKGYISKQMGRKVKEIPVPVLQLRDLEVSLEQVRLGVRDTGADWLVNKIVEGFGDRFTEIISSNLCEQVREQVEEALVNINGYFAENPEVLLGVLDISLDDLDEMTVFV